MLRHVPRRLVPLLGLYPALAACGVDEPVEQDPTTPARFQVRPGVEIATVSGAQAGQPLTLVDARGEPRITLLADSWGQAHFSYLGDELLTLDTSQGIKLPITRGTTLPPGGGYTIRDLTQSPPEASPPFAVLGVHDAPDTSAYEGQPLGGVHYGFTGVPSTEDLSEGFGYITVRDGVKLSVMVRFPDPVLWGSGPWPTVIEYSGYGTSRPEGPDPGSRIATLLGYATVGVNMRGTGCSGGVFDVFNPAQHADGYDVVEVVARQPWVLHGKPGMIGLSYSGISQLFVGRTAPPSLAAIAPLSVIADPWQMQWPGGIYNEGFTKQWLSERDAQAASGGQSWTDVRIAGGDTVCEEHQRLRQQNIDFEPFLHGFQYYPPSAADRSLPLLVPEIVVPVFLAGAWQDEQTGPLFAGMLDRFTGAPHAHFTMYNGRHPDGYSPLVITRWWEFLELNVAQRVPRMLPFIRALAGPELAKEFGVSGLGFEDDRYAEFGEGDYARALEFHRAEPRYRVLFESGAAGPAPGAPMARFEATWSEWPPPASTRSFYFGPGGGLLADPPSASGADAYVHDPDSGSTGFFGPRGYELMAPLWDIDWTRHPAERSLAYVTEPLAEDLTVVGPGWAELYFQAEVGDVHVEVTLTDVRPDGNEYLVQSGRLRLGHRKVDDARSDDLRVERTFSEDDFSPMPIGEWVPVKIPIAQFAHVFRAGSRLQVTVATPGRNHGTWKFESPDYGGATPRHRVGWGASRASRVYLPIVEGLPIAPGNPECPGLRGQPCRPYVATANSSG
ncbi:MAG: CocE/NonD family hydrolase [Polyangiaceae bacterium]|nr:CocE/NonD family hydrolase [Polyangiaceae bacterium]